MERSHSMINCILGVETINEVGISL